MADLHEIVRFLDTELDIESIRDYAGAVNGLQIENSGMVRRVVAAVDASLAVFEHAASVPGTLLLVHHGMFWQGVRPITGAIRRKIKMALDHDLALYSSHLPLDVHTQWGNNILLARSIGLKNIEPLPPDKRSGASMGLVGEWLGEREEFLKCVASAVEGGVHHCPGGPREIRRVAVITGGAGSEVENVAATGVDTFVTGEGPHWSYPLAEEIGINLIYAGHYATETFGVRALSARIAALFEIPHDWIHRPTGL
jgi:dinuclear metal center YbgI/SA1388 family protein